LKLKKSRKDDSQTIGFWPSLETAMEDVVARVNSEFITIPVLAEKESFCRPKTGTAAKPMKLR
jgi:hypothetical protein